MLLVTLWWTCESCQDLRVRSMMVECHTEGDATFDVLILEGDSFTLVIPRSRFDSYRVVAVAE